MGRGPLDVWLHANLRVNMVPSPKGGIEWRNRCFCPLRSLFSARIRPQIHRVRMTPLLKDRPNKNPEMGGPGNKPKD